MKKIKLLLLALPLLLCGCESNKNNSTLVAITEPAYKQEFYNYLETNYPNLYIITVDFRITEARTFDCYYIAANVYYTVGRVYIKHFIIAANPDYTINQVAECIK